MLPCHSPVLKKPCALIALLPLMALAGCIAGGSGIWHMPDANYNDGENYVICFQLTAPGGNASKAFTDAYIVLEGVRAQMTRTHDSKYKVEFEYRAKTADLVGKIPEYHFEYSGGALDRFMNWTRRTDRRNSILNPSARSEITSDGYRVFQPTESVSKPVSAVPDAVYDSIDQIKFDPPITRYEMGAPYTCRQFDATLYDKENNVVGQLKPYSLGNGGWYISYSDDNRPITVFKRRPNQG